MHPLSHTRLWTAIITPMLANGEIDFDGFKLLLREQEDAGNGVVLLGSTGEGGNLRANERRAVVEFACGLSLQIPLLAGVGGLELHSQLDWLAFCETQPLAGYLLVTPIYAKPGAQGQLQWFKALLDAVQRPCMLYNIPSRAGVPLADVAIEGLLGHPNLWAVKESGGDPARFAQLKHDFPQIAWYSGDDVLFTEHAALGAAGLVSVAANVWPKQVAEWVAYGLDHDAGSVGPLLCEVAEALFCAANPIPSKALMHAQGRIQSPILRLPLTQDDLPGMNALWAAQAKVELSCALTV